ncbi:Os01g0150750 [Oryza sativa Japonica Group]|uniref:Os01g0150750 protein n=1 Tax=Oryza sativa subsp. japonica TaxID=39947 RepID=A0A0P0UYB6_ORYSJ|nr:Os01g0150750 [Oryza sativa Japonica Group]
MDYGAIGSNRRGGGRGWGQHGCASESLSPARHGGYWLGKPETEKRRGLRRRAAAAAAAGLPTHEADVWAPPRHGPPVSNTDNGLHETFDHRCAAQMTNLTPHQYGLWAACDWKPKLWA